MRYLNTFLALIFATLILPACGNEDHDDHDHHGHGHHGHDHDPNEVMTTVKLNFVPESGGETLTFGWADPENDGDPVIDPIVLTEGETYTVNIEILNELEDPAEDVTIELREELDEHQFFFTGDAVASPANEATAAIITQEYADEDANGDPVGLANTIVATAAGNGEMTLMLRHMPPVNDTPVKTSGLADLVKNGDVASLPGNVDIEVTFDVTVE